MNEEFVLHFLSSDASVADPLHPIPDIARQAINIKRRWMQLHLCDDAWMFVPILSSTYSYVV